MNYLLLPTKKVVRDMKNARGNDFRADFWGKFNESEKYEIQLQKLKNDFSSIEIDKTHPAKRTYLTVGVDDKSTSKTSAAQEIWSASHLSVVASNAGNIVVSGDQRDVETFGTYLNKASFRAAKDKEHAPSRKDMNIYREAFSITSIRSSNSGLVGRVHPALEQLVKEKRDLSVKVIIDIASDYQFDSLEQVRLLMAKYIPESSIILLSIQGISTSLAFQIESTYLALANLLADEELNLVRFISPHPEISLSRNYVTVQTSNVSFNDPITDEVVGIFDSGTSDSIVRRYMFTEEKHIKDLSTTNTYHGDAMASLILFGENPKAQLDSGSISPMCKYLDIQVLDGSNKIPDIKDVVDAISKVIPKYPNVKIYNFSIANSVALWKNQKSLWTELLDNISRKYDVLIVCAVGNHQVYTYEDNYQKIFESPDAWITDPGDGTNVLTVGSITNIVDDKTICSDIRHISPFSRINSSTTDSIKPELVEIGGNLERDTTKNYTEDFLTKSGQKYGVEFYSNNLIIRDAGTSFSAPLVARKAAYVLHRLKQSNTPNFITTQGNTSNLLKALLIHSASLHAGELIVPDFQTPGVGFGLPDISDIFEYDSNNTFRFAYADNINLVQKKQKFFVKLPDSIINNRTEFYFTLVYNPPVDRNFSDKYNRICIESSLRFVENEGDTEAKYANPASGKNSLTTQVKSKASNVIHFKSVKNQLPTNLLEIGIQVTAEDGVLNDEIQNYALMLSVVQPSNDNLYKEIMETQQFVEYKVEVTAEEQSTSRAEVGIS